MGWAVISRQKIADELDLTKRCVINIINTLIEKGLVIKDEKTNFLRATDIYCKFMQEKSNWAIANIDANIMSAPQKIMQNNSDEQNRTGGEKNSPLNISSGEKFSLGGENNSPRVVKIIHPDGEKFSPNNNIYNNIDNNINNIKEQKIDFSDMLIFLDIFSCIKSGVLEQEESIRQEWIKLTEAERQKAIEWARKVQEYRTPEQYVKNPVFLLRYKDFNSPPHRHVENTMAVGAKMTKEEKYAEIMPYCSSTLTIDNVASNFLNRTVEETLDLIMRGEYGKVKSTAARLLAKKYPQVQALFDADYLLDTKFGKKL